jgi:predicted GNAT superfamily acetyltransferase
MSFLLSVHSVHSVILSKKAMQDYLIRPFESVEEHYACEALQEAVWGGGVLAANMTITLCRHGGIAIGAFDAATNQMIGCAVGMLSPAHHAGTLNGLSHHSHIAAVLPAHQGRGIGEAIKRVQADWCRASGLNLMTWTVDPLEARNARLNMGKLGCICRTYLVNCYGLMNDELNAGIASDRFEVEWWLDRDAQRAGVPESAGWQPDALHIDIPADFQRMKRVDHAGAIQARMETREKFLQAFADGYVVVGFEGDGSRAQFTLRKPLRR